MTIIGFIWMQLPIHAIQSVAVQLSYTTEPDHR